MAESLEGVVQSASNPKGGAVPDASNAVDSLSQYLATSNTSSNPQGGDGQGGTQVQGAVAPQSQQANTPVPTVPDSREELIRKFQSEADRARADAMRLQQQLLELQQRAFQQQSQVAEQNPYDPQTQGAEWWDWRIRSAVRQASQETREGIMRELAGAAQMAQENQWLQTHPGADLTSLKLQAQARYGVQSPTMQMIEDLYALSQMPAMVTGAATNAINQTINNMNRPQQGPSTVRGAMPSGQVPQTTQLSYEKLAEAYVQTNGAAYDRWPAEVRTLFDRETFARDAASRSSR